MTPTRFPIVLLRPLGQLSIACGEEVNIMAPQVGFEPTTYRLTAGCSTTELLRNVTFASEHFSILATFFLFVNAFLKKFLVTRSCLVAVVLTTSIIYHAPK